MKLIIVFTLILLNSCTSLHKLHKSSAVKVDINAPMRAKLDVDLTRKLTGYASAIYLFHLFKITGDGKYADNVTFAGDETDCWFCLGHVDDVKDAATYNAIRKSKADMLINPRYVVEESVWNPFYKEIKIKVTGYPGTIISIENEDNYNTEVKFKDNNEEIPGFFSR